MPKFNAGAVKTFDQDTVENDGPMFPFIQYNNGNPRLARAGGMEYQGGFFIPKTAIQENLGEFGWEPEKWTHSGNSVTDGWYSRDISVAILHIRRRWEVWKNGQRMPFAWNDFNRAKEQGSPSSRTQVLCYVKGLEPLGPMMLTLKGYAAMYFDGSRQTPGCLTVFRNSVIRAANMATADSKSGKGLKWPFRAFWLTIGPDRNSKGEPVFFQAGKGNATSPVAVITPIDVPARTDEVDLDKFYVGDELLEELNLLYQDTAETWAKAWDSIGQTEVAKTNTKTNDAIDSAFGDPLDDDVNFKKPEELEDDDAF